MQPLDISQTEMVSGGISQGFATGAIVGAGLFITPAIYVGFFNKSLVQAALTIVVPGLVGAIIGEAYDYVQTGGNHASVK